MNMLRSNENESRQARVCMRVSSRHQLSYAQSNENKSCMKVDWILPVKRSKNSSPVQTSKFFLTSLVSLTSSLSRFKFSLTSFVAKQLSSSHQGRLLFATRTHFPCPKAGLASFGTTRLFG